MLRSAAALLLALSLLALAGAPHVHAPAGEGHECVACATAGSAAVPVQPPVVAVAAPQVEELALAPGLAPVTGAPLGAIPGQSPPAV